MPDRADGPLFDADDDDVPPTHYRVTSGGRLILGNPGYPEAGGWRPLDNYDGWILRAAEGVTREPE
jgi:hypothetical protein